MNRTLQRMVRYRVAVAAVGYLLVFLGLTAVFFLVAPQELTSETRVSAGQASVVVYGGPQADTIMSSPVTLIIMLIAAILLIGWIIFANKAASRLEQDKHNNSKV